MRAQVWVHYFGNGGEKLDQSLLPKVIAEDGALDIVGDMVTAIVGGAVAGGWVGAGVGAAQAAYSRLAGDTKAARTDKLEVTQGGWDTPRVNVLASYIIVEFQAYTEDPIKVPESFGLVDPKNEIIDMRFTTDRHGDDNQWWYRFYLPMAILSSGVYRFSFGSGDKGTFKDASVGCMLELTVRPGRQFPSIDDKYRDVASSLGQPIGPAIAAFGGQLRDYQFGTIYSSRGRGPCETHGAICEKWKSLGRENSFLGCPITDETPTADGVGRFNCFQGGTIFWHPRIGAHEVHGGIREEYARQTWELGRLGYPISDEGDGPTPGSRVSRFERGSIEWSPTGGIAVR